MGGKGGSKVWQDSRQKRLEGNIGMSVWEKMLGGKVKRKGWEKRLGWEKKLGWDDRLRG